MVDWMGTRIQDLLTYSYQIQSSGTKQWTKQLGTSSGDVPMELPLILQAMSMSEDIHLVDWMGTRVQEA